jgi:hypothetical protein
MVRFLLRHGLVRVVGGRLVPALMVWDLAVLANRTRRIPVVDRGLRRGASAARDGLGTVVRRGSDRARRTRDRRRSADPTDRA